MSLIVETGTGASNSESYISVADADTYFSNRGNATWGALNTSQKEQALRKSTDYLEQSYRLRWLGYRKLETQSLSWPRDEVPRADFTYLNQYSFYPDNVVPEEVKRACAEMALKSNSGELIPDLTQLVTKEKIDVIEIEYSEYSNQLPRYKAIDYLLAPFLQGNSNSMKVIRT